MSLQEPVDQYSFKYRLCGDRTHSTKYFMAGTVEQAIYMFDYISKKKKIDLEEVNITRYNRWSKLWEDVNYNISAT